MALVSLGLCSDFLDVSFTVFTTRWALSARICPLSHFLISGHGRPFSAGSVTFPVPSEAGSVAANLCSCGKPLSLLRCRTTTLLDKLFQVVGSFSRHVKRAPRPPAVVLPHEIALSPAALPLLPSAPGLYLAFATSAAAGLGTGLVGFVRLEIPGPGCLLPLPGWETCQPLFLPRQFLFLPLVPLLRGSLRRSWPRGPPDDPRLRCWFGPLSERICVDSFSSFLRSGTALQLCRVLP